MIFEKICSLLAKTEAGSIPIRLAGVTVSGFPKEEEMCQLEFDFLKDFPFSRKEW